MDFQLFHPFIHKKKKKKIILSLLVLSPDVILFKNVMWHLIAEDINESSE